MSLSSRIQRAWVTGGLLAKTLRPLGGLNGALQQMRHWLYRWGIKRSPPLPVPLIVVGNWIVGGAGKTPTTLYLLEQLNAWGIQAGVVSRGYGRQGDGVRVLGPDATARTVGDEPLLIHRRSGAPVAVGRDRIAAAQALLAAHPTLQLLLSDDGLQHWRLPRQLSIQVFDERGLGNGRLLPAGPLRQNRTWPALPGSSDRSLTLYNAPCQSTALPGFLAHRHLAGACLLQDWWAGAPGCMRALLALRDRPILAVAGLAQPSRFFDMLQDQGLDIRPLPLPDHHDFGELPWPPDCTDVLLTEKDAIKLHPSRASNTRVWVVALDFRPEHAFAQALHDEVHRLLAPHHGQPTA